MSFAARLSTDLVSVEAGATMPLTVEVANRSEQSDRFELEIEGLDPEWTAIPVPTFVVAAGETASEKIFFRPSRTSESLAGNYPFVVRVRSLESGEVRTVQGVLAIKPYHHISVEISPKKGMVAPMRKRNRFRLTLVNLGNSEHTLQLYGSDPEEALAFDFEHDQVALAPGQQKEVWVTVQPGSTPLLATSRLSGFLITARSNEAPTVAGAAQAQLEERPALSPSVLMLLAIMAIAMGLWYVNRPMPPQLELGVVRDEATVGESVQVWWRSSHATRVTLTAGEDVIYDGPKPSGALNYTVREGGRLIFAGIARSEDKVTERQMAAVDVTVPPPAPEPKIQKFALNQSTANVGESVLLSYSFNDAVTRAYLQPQGIELNLQANELEIQISEPGKRTYTVIAQNREGKTVRASASVTAQDVSQAKVIAFEATPSSIPYPGGLTKVTWQLADAVYAKLTPNPMSDTGEIDPKKGELQVYVDKDTTFTLTASDAKGRKLTQTVKVDVGEPPVPPEPMGDTGPP